MVKPLDGWGIYTLEKDTLKLALILGDIHSKEGVPKEFKTKKGDGVYIFVFQREKKK